MTVVLGVDGGGSKTHVVLADTTGKILGFYTAGPTNWELIGLLPAGRALREGIEAALSAAGASAADVEASVFGLAGVDWPADVPRIENIVHPLGLGGHREIVNDSFVALRAGASRPWGVVVIAGAGTVTAGRNEAGEVFRTLGLGPAYGEFGGRRRRIPRGPGGPREGLHRSRTTHHAERAPVRGSGMHVSG